MRFRVSVLGSALACAALGALPPALAESGSALVPGGLRPLMALVRGREDTPPERFFIEYSKAIIHQIPAPQLAASVADHFRRVQALQALGVRQGERVSLTLSLNDKAARRGTSAALDLLGWQVRSTGGRTTVDVREGGAAAERQLTANLLGIDPLALEKALSASGRYRYDVNDEPAPVLFGEALWRAEFYPGRPGAGAFAYALADDPRLAQVYVALARLDPGTARALLSGIGLEALVERNADTLHAFGSALSIAGGRAVVPGGLPAEPTWENLAGASPREPARFFRALLRKDDAKLLAFFFALTQLDLAHQRFFASSAARVGRFYDLFKDAPDVGRGAKRSWRSTPFIDFVAQLPLDAEGRVRFPGSPAVWMVAKGHSSSASATGKLLEKVSRVATPDVEDEILVRLARTVYGVSGDQRSQLDNFLAVARLEAHRSDALDEATALLLSQGFARWEHAWPYLSLLGGLGRSEIEAWAGLEERLGQLQGVELNVVMGQVHALLQLLCLARQADALTERQGTQVFALFCRRYAAADSKAAFVAAGLDTARALLERAAGAGPVRDAGEAMRAILLGPASAPVAVTLADGRSWQVDGARERHLAFERVLELQAVPPLQALFDLREALAGLATTATDAADRLRVIEAAVAALPDTQVPKTATGVFEETLAAYEKRRIVDRGAKLARTLAKQQVKPKDVAERAEELSAELNPMLTLALAGLVYAHYTRPDDLLVSEDPLLLRKHQYVELAPDRKKTGLLFTPAGLDARGPSGSWPHGGLAEFSSLAGRIALPGTPGADTPAQEFLVRQVGFLRSTRWDKVQDSDLRLVGLRVRAGREWIVLAARDPEAAARLSSATLGLVSLARREQLLRAVSSSDWDSAWASVSLSDLFALGQEYAAADTSGSGTSPTLRALQELASETSSVGLQWLGPDPGPLNNCSHPHLLRLLPYEHYTRFQLPDRLAIRSGELKLYLAELLDRESVPAAAAQSVAEPLARRVFAGMRLSDVQDWPSALAAYARLDRAMLSEVLVP